MGCGGASVVLDTIMLDLIDFKPNYISLGGTKKL
jgi:hypothetical protein